ncbi:MAG: hypothetical protein K6A61_10600 [Butyrivibrio sp.]|jgi:hypothetical protein|uniref:Uncharacterized protein n=1 Tax=Butyrivibrio hungatei TaxID=185008 RepID=A0A1G5B075_9FIRM|nr:DUF6115 domain-containing protein [Butyrivibrio hungatei]MBQ4221033.1 hypothetical protein [Butyrivibrio sp.]MBR4358596.1 hypothetical protein [Butyrivibrio sp.]MBR4640138.1 hypothetical protein [Butyrivibrio sp.]MCR4997732.1 hypothetical protein [Butyrivibrio sp.]MEE3471888.1 DUF6115 domain-containing protein [Butyrivibrio hungatei]
MISITEIVLIVVGFAAIILGYLLPAGKKLDEEDKMLMEREIRELVRREVEDQRENIENMVDDTVDLSLDRTERAMERISNEKLSAIGEYSDTVINDIHKNHDEVMFMYDMLNDKHKNLTSVVSEVTKKADEAKKVVKEVEEKIILPTEPEEPVPVATVEKEPVMELEKITAKVITPEEAMGLHVVGNTSNDEDEIKPIQEQQPNAKVVPITEAVRVEAKSTNPDKNMKELTAADPISQNRQIIEMHKAGKSNMVIARELGLGIGEVKLVIDLSNKHRKVK